jgi:hypothetical protein
MYKKVGLDSKLDAVRSQGLFYNWDLNNLSRRKAR